ncbi:unnamed protein product [Allacma fusca]|uniref:Uncharacterized protein n=1 Tax=Allacma fusca TaxID=39272 RepID=A0A8J2NXL3_9HEXA|nr:unnamed protein product [Allacma fusca]
MSLFLKFPNTLRNKLQINFIYSMDMADLQRLGFQHVQQQASDEPVPRTGQVGNSSSSEDSQPQMSSPMVLTPIVIIQIETTPFLHSGYNQPAIFPNMGTPVTQILQWPNAIPNETCHALCPCRTQQEEPSRCLTSSLNGNGVLPIVPILQPPNSSFQGQITIPVEGNSSQIMCQFVAPPYLPYMINQQQYYPYYSTTLSGAGQPQNVYLGE